jgi:cytochrome c-type biogenesis protein CcmH
MRGATSLLCLACLAVLAGGPAFLSGCDRNMEPFVEGEQPRDPDLSKIFPAGADQVARLDESVELPQPPGVAPAPGATRRGPDVTANAAPVSGVVRVAPEIAEELPEGGVGFLIARRGPGPPVAVRRVADPSFPLRFSIGPQDRMIEGVPFEGPLEIEARLDLDGEAISRGPDDLAGRSAGGHQPGASDVEIVIGPLGSQQAARGAASAPSASPQAEAAGGAPLSGVVSVSPELAEGLPAGAVLFIIARVGSAGPPLAVRRVPSPSFPLEFSIGPEDRMIATRPFAGEIQLSARLDQDGNATSRSPGDLQGSSVGPHAPGDSEIEIRLQEQL